MHSFDASQSWIGEEARQRYEVSIGTTIDAILIHVGSAWKRYAEGTYIHRLRQYGDLRFLLHTADTEPAELATIGVNGGNQEDVSVSRQDKRDEEKEEKDLGGFGPAEPMSSCVPYHNFDTLPLRRGYPSIVAGGEGMLVGKDSVASGVEASADGSKVTTTSTAKDEGSQQPRVGPIAFSPADEFADLTGAYVLPASTGQISEVISHEQLCLDVPYLGLMPIWWNGTSVCSEAEQEAVERQMVEDRQQHGNRDMLEDWESVTADSCGIYGTRVGGACAGVWAHAPNEREEERWLEGAAALLREDEANADDDLLAGILNDGVTCSECGDTRGAQGCEACWSDDEMAKAGHLASGHIKSSSKSTVMPRHVAALLLGNRKNDLVSGFGFMRYKLLASEKDAVRGRHRCVVTAIPEVSFIDLPRLTATNCMIDENGVLRPASTSTEACNMRRELWADYSNAGDHQNHRSRSADCQMGRVVTRYVRQRRCAVVTGAASVWQMVGERADVKDMPLVGSVVANARVYCVPIEQMKLVEKWNSESHAVFMAMMASLVERRVKLHNPSAREIIGRLIDMNTEEKEKLIMSGRAGDLKVFDGFQSLKRNPALYDPVCRAIRELCRIRRDDGIAPSSAIARGAFLDGRQSDPLADVRKRVKVTPTRVVADVVDNCEVVTIRSRERAQSWMRKAGSDSDVVGGICSNSDGVLSTSSAPLGSGDDSGSERVVQLVGNVTGEADAAPSGTVTVQDDATVVKSLLRMRCQHGGSVSANADVNARKTSSCTPSDAAKLCGGVQGRREEESKTWRVATNDALHRTCIHMVRLIGSGVDGLKSPRDIGLTLCDATVGATKRESLPDRAICVTIP